MYSHILVNVAYRPSMNTVPHASCRLKLQIERLCKTLHAPPAPHLARARRRDWRGAPLRPIWAKAKKSHLLSGAPLSGLLPVVGSLRRLGIQRDRTDRTPFRGLFPLPVLRNSYGSHVNAPPRGCACMSAAPRRCSVWSCFHISHIENATTVNLRALCRSLHSINTVV